MQLTLNTSLQQSQLDFSQLTFNQLGITVLCRLAILSKTGSNFPMKPGGRMTGNIPSIMCEELITSGMTIPSPIFSRVFSSS